jgi:hypothetical protein
LFQFLLVETATGASPMAQSGDEENEFVYATIR